MQMPVLCEHTPIFGVKLAAHSVVPSGAILSTYIRDACWQTQTTISSTRPIAAKYRSLTVAVINVVADHPLFVTLTGERS